VERVCHGDFEITNLLGATFIAGKTLRSGFLGLEPKISFERGDYLGLELLGQGKQVADMIRVAVRDENGIEPGGFFQIFRAARVGHYKGIDDGKLAAGCGQAKGAVPEINDLVSLQIKH
jgi:hypothetical protein